jgi:hypothetical protein
MNWLAEQNTMLLLLMNCPRGEMKFHQDNRFD